MKAAYVADVLWKSQKWKTQGDKTTQYTARNATIAHLVQLGAPVLRLLTTADWVQIPTQGLLMDVIPS